MARAKHLERLRNMLRQVTPESAFESTSSSSGFEKLEVPDQHRDAAVEGMKRLNSVESLRDDTIDHPQQMALEAIILPKLRPVVNIVGDTFSPPPSPWDHFGNPDFKQRIDKAIPSIGRVELPGNPSIPYGGTGFVVGPNLLMTNRHVAEIFATGLGQRGLTFLPGRASAMDFKREIVGTVPQLLSVTKVVMIHPYWDMALLEVAGLPANHPMLSLSVRASDQLAEREIAVIGYPAQDFRNDQTLQAQIFGGIFNVKRLQPGKLKVVRTIESFGHEVNAITHDASTLGGNSGSAVLDVLTGEVTALHFAGLYLDANFGVPTYELARDTRVVDAGVNFNGKVAPTSDWAAVWKLADQGAESPSSAQTPVPPVSTKPGASIPTNPINGNTATWTIPLQISVTVGTPAQLGAPAVAVTTPVVPAPSPITAIAAREAVAANASVTEAYAKFDATSLSPGPFSWKAVLSTAVCSHLAYELPDVIVATIRDRFGMPVCEFVQNDDTVCFVAATADTIVVSFRGTKAFVDWLTDLNAFSVEASYGQLHRGFYFAFQAVKSSLERIFQRVGLTGRQLVLTGHSLGGALATVAAAEWAGTFDIRSIYTYGQPRVGKVDFADYMERYVGSKFYRIVNDDDIVPRVPPGYVHIGQLSHFGPTGDVSNEAVAAAVTNTEAPALTEAQFAELKASLSSPTTATTTESVGLEGFFPSISDHYLANYMAKILKQTS